VPRRRPPRTPATARRLEPHRLVGTFSELRLRGNCANGQLTGFAVIPSEAGVSLAMAVEGLEGFTNLDLSDGSDTPTGGVVPRRRRRRPGRGDPDHRDGH
jgi:hypothetical protein